LLRLDDELMRKLKKRYKKKLELHP
jgi:hypothetical protein